MTTDPALSFVASLSRSSFSLDAAFDGAPGMTALFGPSGAGKTTVLHLIAGLLKPAQGRIAVAGETLTDTARTIFIPTYKRRVGYVFQDAQLFPHLTVAQNIKFGRWFTKPAGNDLSAETVVDVLGIAPLMGRRPATLSGGEKQRVALARALLASPRLLLLDEPLAGLDDARRHEIMTLIERVKTEFRVPIVYVTHTRDEVRRLADHVVHLNAGRVVASGLPSQVLGD